MYLTTLCYIEKDGKYLMLHRVKKQNDMNRDKYIGIGGHVEDHESPLDCILREAWEETGLTLKNPELRGVITFLIDDITEITFLYTCRDFSGELTECSEGVLEWVDKSKIRELPLWEGDHIFLDLLETETEVFELKLVYKNDILIKAENRGNTIF